jgi:thiamine-monophosphate kinase
LSVVAEVIITGADRQTLGELGEFGLIAELRKWLPPNSRTLVGIGDDAAVLATPDGRVVATTDFLLEGRHFRRDWSSATDVGHKAAARSLADLAAMGAVPSALLVALAGPADLPVSWARDLAAGLAAECLRVEGPGASVIGGDTARADVVLLAVTGLGDLEGRAPVLRSGATPGDVVAVAGPLGHAAAGLALLSAGIPDHRLVSAQLRPAPPYDAGPEAAELGASAMIDVSDGLLADLGHIAAASGVLIDLRSAALAPATAPLLAVPAELRYASSTRTGRIPATRKTTSPEPGRPQPGSLQPGRPERGRPEPGRPQPGRPEPGAPELDARQRGVLPWVLTGGEDHSFAATFPPGARLPSRWTVIGTVRPAPEQPGPGVVVDGQPWLQSAGWDHFTAGQAQQ